MFFWQFIYLFIYLFSQYFIPQIRLLLKFKNTTLIFPEMFIITDY